MKVNVLFLSRLMKYVFELMLFKIGVYKEFYFSIVNDFGLYLWYNVWKIGCICLVVSSVCS